MKPLTKTQTHILLSCATLPSAVLVPLSKRDLLACLSLFRRGMLDVAESGTGGPTAWRITKLGLLQSNQLRRNEPRP